MSLELVGVAVAIATTTLRLVITLKTFRDQMRVCNAVLDGLIERLEQLQNEVFRLESTLGRTARRASEGGGESNREILEACSDLRVALERMKRRLDQFEIELGALMRDGSPTTALGRAIRQLRVNDRNGTLERLQRDIDSQQTSIFSAFSTIHLELSLQTNELVGALFGNRSSPPLSQVSPTSSNVPDHAIPPSAVRGAWECSPTSLEDISETNILSDGLADRLVRAVEDQDVAEVKRLLSQGAPITAVDTGGQNLLDIACGGVKNSNQASLVGVLIAGGLKNLKFADDESRDVLKNCKRELKLREDFKQKKRQKK